MSRHIWRGPGRTQAPRALCVHTHAKLWDGVCRLGETDSQFTGKFYCFAPCALLQINSEVRALHRLAPDCDLCARVGYA